MLRNSTRYLRNGRVSLRAHLFGPRESSILELSPLATAEGRAARVKISFAGAGLALCLSGLLFNTIYHPDVQIAKDERGMTLRDTRTKARRFASHRKLASHRSDTLAPTHA